jgi:hypothetical protein
VTIIIMSPLTITTTMSSSLYSKNTHKKRAKNINKIYNNCINLWLVHIMTTMRAIVKALAFLSISVSCGQAQVNDYDSSDLPVVVIRIDDVVTYFCEEAGLVAINTVIDLKTPICVGIIANGLTADKTFAKSLNKIAQSEYVEIVSHSFLHNDYTGNTYDWQYADLEDAEAEIAKVTGLRPTTFIPPRNTYDETTIQAVKDFSDLNLMSAQCSWKRDGSGQKYFCNEGSDVVAPNITYENLYMLPTGAVMGDQGYFKNYLLPASLTDAVGWMEAQIANQGFSVLMLHPLEFATDETCLHVDEAKITVLKEIIAYGQGKWQFMTFQQALEYYTGVKSKDTKVKASFIDDTAGTTAPELAFALALVIIAAITLITCFFSFTVPIRTKLMKCFDSKPKPAPVIAILPVTAGAVQMNGYAHLNPIEKGTTSPLQRMV